MRLGSSYFDDVIAVAGPAESATIDSVAWQTAHVRPALDLLAPDGSEIRLLVRTERASMVHCTLPRGQVTRAVHHRSVQELWFCLAGAGELWRRVADREEVVELSPGTAVTIPTGAAFQFRTIGHQSLELVIASLPAWPGPDEAVRVDGRWPPTG
jgi:mannose-6-phosphate isomerase-like protein (cupin superfamily)